MTAYTLFGQPANPATLTSDSADYTMGVQFSVSQAGCTLTAVWFWSAPGAAGLPETIALWAVTGQSLVHSETASWSGAAGSGWVKATFASPPSLTASTAYKASVFSNSGNFFYSGTSHYWDTGAGSAGITNGPLSAPSNAGAAQGQDTFTSGSVMAYPATSFNASNYWVDPEITTGGASHTATASLTVTPSFTAGRTRGRYRTGSLAVTPSFTAGRTAAHVRSGSLTVAPSFRAVPSGGAATAQTGSWWGLDSVFKQSRNEFETFVSRPPTACPNCGEPLRNGPATPSGSGVELYCKYDGWQYPRDYVAPQRPWT